MVRSLNTAIAVLCFLITPASAWSQNADHSTIQNALLSRGVPEALAAEDGPAVDRAVHSSSFAVNADTFVAAYYFADEMERGTLLGPLHVSRFDRRGRRWVHAPELPEDVGGSVLRVVISNRYVSLTLHHTPSAGQSVLLDPETLQLISVLSGFIRHELDDGSVIYFRSLRHFAPYHQSVIAVFDPATGRDQNVFPEATESRLVIDYRRRLMEAYDALPEARRAQIPWAGFYDFDRDFWNLATSGRGDVVAFVAQYDSDALWDVPPPQLWTIVVCRRRAAGWSCDERELEEWARESNLRLTRDSESRFSQQALDRAVRMMVESP